MTREALMGNDTITQQVSERYARAVTTGEQMCCPTGYDFDDLRRFVPEEVLKVSYGCGTPAGLRTVRPGETVLDIGSGGGIDCFEALRRVGPTGLVIGLDMTDEMLALARRHAPVVAANLGHPTPNVEFRKGLADAMPVEDGTIDLIISNCVINLAPDKPRVFREMYRSLKPGGRFTISDIVSDQPLPQYLVHDTEKWGNCLSGALQVADYLDGLRQAGFLGIHQVTFTPWQVIDGIRFLSLTLTGYKLPEQPEPNGARFATLRGPFSRAVDELGQVYLRGVPQAVNARTAHLLHTPPFDGLFLLTDTPVALDASDPHWTAILPEQASCIWEGHFALFTGPLLEVCDDDQHCYVRGQPLEICSKTLKVLRHEAYAGHFAVINRAQSAVTGAAVSCNPSGSCC
ncbi:MAG: methyltransferase domain-containing protein [Nitrospirota bacterium]